MTDNFDKVNAFCSILKLDLCGSELANIAVKHNYSEEILNAIFNLLSHLSKKKEMATIQDILNKSRLPKTAPKTSDNFDFTHICGQDVERIRAISSLATLYSGSNIAFVGPPGIGKTHLAQAYGYECAQHGIKIQIRALPVGRALFCNISHFNSYKDKRITIRILMITYSLCQQY